MSFPELGRSARPVRTIGVQLRFLGMEVANYVISITSLSAKVPVHTSQYQRAIFTIFNKPNYCVRYARKSKILGS